MTQPPDYTISPFVPEVHNERNRSSFGDAMSQNQQAGMRGKLIESILQIVVQAISGVFVPGGLGSAFQQLSDWALDVATSIPIIGDIISFILEAFGFDVENDGEADGPSLWDSVVQVFINPLGFFANLIGGFLPNFQLDTHDASKIGTGSFADGFLPGLLGLFNSLFAGFLGGIEPDTQASSTDVQQAVTGQSQSVASIGSALAALRARVEALDVTLDVVEEAWEYVAATPDAAKWETTLVPASGWGVAGEPKVDGHQLYWDPSGASSRYARLRYIGAGDVAAGDRMITEMVLGDYLNNIAANALPYLDVIQNMNAAGTQHFTLRLTYNQMAVFTTNGGTTVQFGSTTTLASIPGAGSIVRIDNLNTTSARHYKITINAQDWTFFDSTNAVVQGASNRYRGLGMNGGVNTTGFVFLYQQACGNIAHWAGYSPP